jgi:hypothetical protein
MTIDRHDNIFISFSDLVVCIGGILPSGTADLKENLAGQ